MHFLIMSNEFLASVKISLRERGSNYRFIPLKIKVLHDATVKTFASIKNL